jgi:exodeoxyribonuclease III
MDYKVISYNVNGIRSAGNKGLWNWKKSIDPDIICFQELKAMPEDLDEDIRNPEGYKSYWFPAEKKGYSGVAVYSKVEPIHVEYGCGIEAYDREGRVIRLDFSEFSLLNVYLPSGSSGDERQAFKETFMAEFKEYIADLLTKFPKLLLCGDLNICHKEIDIHNPVSNKTSSGFLPHEREWLSSFMNVGLNDTFRMHHPEPDRYSWWSFRAGSRARNKGWRIDYHLASDAIRDAVVDADIFDEAVHSDHAPIMVRLKF